MGAATGPVSRLVLSTEVGRCADGVSTAAAFAVACATREGGGGVVLAEVSGGPRRRPTLLSSAEARDHERTLRDAGFEAAARGRVCWARLGDDPVESLEAAAAVAGRSATVVAHLPAPDWRSAIESPGLGARAALIRADLGRDRLLVALAVDDLQRRGVGVRVVTAAIGLVAARRALAGLDPGGTPRRRLGRFAAALTGEHGQSLPLVVGASLAVLVIALALVAIGGALTATARGQRSADLVALSTARSMRDDLDRLAAPELLPDGTPNPAHLGKGELLTRAEAAGLQAAERNGLSPRLVRITFPDASSAVPVRARVEVAPSPGSPRDDSLLAEAAATPPAAATGPVASASGAGYAGPLASRQGKPMRPDVAQAFDRLAAAARAAGFGLVVSSGYRSDAEQARLFAANPDPRWVAPPGTSLHRCGTELDLGPAAAYGWLAANASRFGFVKRYAWEPWHFGYTRGPAPCSAITPAAHDDGARPDAVPAFVPPRHRDSIARAAARWNVSAALVAAQLLAESNFDPRAVSSAGARGIAQFMPATAAAYGLPDPFDAPAAIDAQAHLMSDLLARFGSVPLALAAYNAGPAPVAACDCVPPYAETQAYVARILALLGGAGEWSAPLEVRLVA
jgi:hypothetical protein